MKKLIKQLTITLVLVTFVCLSYPKFLYAEVSSSLSSQNQNLVQRLEDIKAAMQKIRFCYNENCFYRNIQSQIIPPATAKSHYTATISATIDRPSTVLDTADYTFAFVDQHWKLIKGEEYTDVAEYSFEGDRYEIFSVHSNRSRKGKLAQARKEGNLKSGYLTVYYDILSDGVEKT